MISKEYLEDVEGVPTYTIIIKDFAEKMKTVEYRNLFLKTKEITVHGGKKFVISICPNGDDHVEIYLINMTLKVDVGVEAEFLMGDVTRYMNNVIKSYLRRGYSKFFPHSEANKAKYKSDEDLKIVVKLFRAEEAFQFLNSKLMKVEGIVHNQRGASGGGEACDMETKVAALESRIAALEMKHGSKIEKPKCPYCFEEMNSTTKIAQCISGHMICWTCKEKDKRDCGLCGQPVFGRAFGMESYLRSIFG